MKKIITNAHASPDQFAHVYRIDGRKIMYQSVDPALSFGKVSDSILKQDFMNAHKDGVGIDQLSSLYGVSPDEFKSTIRTIGTGTHLLIRDGVGREGKLFNPLVARTQTGADGAVNLGKLSRAAGGAKGSLPPSNFREMHEEFICTRSKDGKIIVFNIDYDDDCLSHDEKQTILTVKRQEISEILQVNGMNFNGIDFMTLKAKIMSVPQLTTDITQSIDGHVSLIRNRILKDSPSTGDLAACDIILYIELPQDLSTSDLIILDGERGQNGELLRRDWHLQSPEAWLELMNGGQQQFSPAAMPFYQHLDDVKAAVRKLTL